MFGLGSAVSYREEWYTEEHVVWKEKKTRRRWSSRMRKVARFHGRLYKRNRERGPNLGRQIDDEPEETPEGTPLEIAPLENQPPEGTEGEESKPHVLELAALRVMDE